MDRSSTTLVLAAAASLLLSGAAAAQVADPADSLNPLVQERQSPNPLLQDRDGTGLPIAGPCIDGQRPDGSACDTLSEQLGETGSIIEPPDGIDPEIQVPAPNPTPNTTPVIPPGAIPPQQFDADPGTSRPLTN